MKPLRSVAMGMVIVVLSVRFNGYDVLADPFGWLLVWLGLHELRVAHRTTLLGLATVAGAVACVVWFPLVADDLYAVDTSLAWAASLPQLLFSALLCHDLAARAAAAGDPAAVTWLRLTRTVMVGVAALPVLALGIRSEPLEVASYVAAALAGLLLVCLLVAYAGRPWAGSIGQTPAHAASAS